MRFTLEIPRSFVKRKHQRDYYDPLISLLISTERLRLSNSCLRKNLRGSLRDILVKKIVCGQSNVKPIYNMKCEESLALNNENFENKLKFSSFSWCFSSKSRIYNRNRIKH